MVEKREECDKEQSNYIESNMYKYLHIFLYNDDIVQVFNPNPAIFFKWAVSILQFCVFIPGRNFHSDEKK